MTTTEFNVAVDGDEIVLWLSGELDVASFDDIAALGQLIAAQPAARSVVVDLSEVTFMDSTAVGALIAVRKEAVGHGLTLTLRGITPRVHRILAITGLLDLFGIPDGDAGRC